MQNWPRIWETYKQLEESRQTVLEANKELTEIFSKNKVRIDTFIPISSQRALSESERIEFEAMHDSLEEANQAFEVIDEKASELFAEYKLDLLVYEVEGQRKCKEERKE